MMNKSIILSASGLKNIQINNQEDEFSFIFGKEEIKMKNIYAEFISPRVSHLHHIDPTIQVLDFSTSIKKIEKMIQKEENQSVIEKHNLQRIDEISHGANIVVENKDDIKQLRMISILLENSELYKLIDQYEKTEFSKETNNDSTVNEAEKLLDETELFYNLMPEFDINKYCSHLDYISENLWSINSTRLENTSIDIVYSIISNSHIKHDKENEDKLFDLINKVTKREEKEEDVYRFYELIDLKNLSESKLKELLEKYEISNITQEMWSKIKEIIFSNHSNENKRYIASFMPEDEKEFAGIINYIRLKSDGKIENAIALTSSSIRDSSKTFKEENLTDYQDQNYFFESENRPESWICFDFKEKKVIPRNYQIMSVDNRYPKSWIIEGKNENTEWVPIDSQKDCPHLNGDYKTHIFPVKNINNQEFRYIRLKLTDKTWSNDDFLAITAFEFYGTLI